MFGRDVQENKQLERDFQNTVTMIIHQVNVFRDSFMNVHLGQPEIVSNCSLVSASSTVTGRALEQENGDHATSS